MLPSNTTPSSSLPILALAPWGWIVCVLAVAWSAIGLGLCLRYVMVWRSARRANAPLTFGEIIAMRRRKVDPGLIIQAYHEAKEHRLKLTINQIERHHAHGDINDEIVAADKLTINLADHGHVVKAVSVR